MNSSLKSEQSIGNTLDLLLRRLYNKHINTFFLDTDKLTNTDEALIYDGVYYINFNKILNLTRGLGLGSHIRAYLAAIPRIAYFPPATTAQEDILKTFHKRHKLALENAKKVMNFLQYLLVRDIPICLFFSETVMGYLQIPSLTEQAKKKVSSHYKVEQLSKTFEHEINLVKQQVLANKLLS